MLLLLALLTLDVAFAYGDFGLKSVLFSSGSSVQSFAAFADFDGDGLVDVAVAHSSSQTIGWHKNLGTQSNGAILWSVYRQLYSTSGPVTAITASDVDRDGRPDIIYGCRYNGVYWIAMKSYGNSGPYRLTWSGTPQKILVGDVNGDYVADLLIAEADNGKISYLRGTYSDPYYSYSSETLILSTGGDEVQLVRIDNDATLDLLVASRGSLKFYINNGRGGFSLYRYVDVWTKTRVLAFDFDRDGKTEYLAVRQDGTSGLSIGSWPNFEIRARFPGLQITSFMSVLNQKTGDFVASTLSGLWWFENNDNGKSFRQHFIGYVNGNSWDGTTVFCANLTGNPNLDVGFISNLEVSTFRHNPDPVSPPSYYPPPTNPWNPPTNPWNPPTAYEPTGSIIGAGDMFLIVGGAVVGVLILVGALIYAIRKHKQANAARQATLQTMTNNTLATTTQTTQTPGVSGGYAYNPVETIQPSFTYTGATVPVSAPGGYGAPPGYFGGPLYVTPPTYTVAEGAQYPGPQGHNVYNI